MNNSAMRDGTVNSLKPLEKNSLHPFLPLLTIKISNLKT